MSKWTKARALWSALALVTLAALFAGCGDDDDGAAATPTPDATPVETIAREIDLETFVAGDTYTLGLQEMSDSGVTGTVVLTGVADGDVSVAVEVGGLTEGEVALRGGISRCPVDAVPSISDKILTLSPLVGGVSETSPVGVSTETFSGEENIFVFSGPWALIVSSTSGEPVACGIIPQE